MFTQTYLLTKHANTRHLSVDGEETLCGREIELDKVKEASLYGWKEAPICRQCKKRGPKLNDLPDFPGPYLVLADHSIRWYKSHLSDDGTKTYCGATLTRYNELARPYKRTPTCQKCANPDLLDPNLLARKERQESQQEKEERLRKLIEPFS